MVKIYKDIKQIIQKQYNELSLEEQFFNVSLFFVICFTLISYLSNVLLKISDDLNASILIACFAGVGMLYFSFFKRKSKYIKLPITAFMTSVVAVSWFELDGVNGSTPYFVFITIIMAVYMNHHRLAWLYVVFYVALGFTLYAFQVAKPELFSTYASSQQRHSDLVNTFLLSLLFVGGLVLALKRNYERERDKVVAQKAEIEQYSEEIRLQNEKILLQNALLEQKNKELADLNRTKDKFFSIIGHDLKNPVSVIMGFSHLLNTKLDEYDKDKTHKFIGHIEDSSKQVYLLLENLLTWANCQTGKISYYPQKEEFHTLIKGVHSLIREFAIRKDISLSIECESNIRVTCDRNMINTVLRNLLSNAIKFTPNGGKVSLKTIRVNETSITIQVEDSGVGLNEQQIANILGDSTSFTTVGTNQETGTGLGLSLCKEFLTHHHSSLQISSMPGIGSCFSFSLAIAE